MKLLKKLLLAVIIAVFVIALLLSGYAIAQPVIYADYYNCAVREFEAAGLSDGMVPQGLAYCDGVYLQCGYMADNVSPSRIYITTPNGGRFVELFTADGEAYCGHTGGLAVGEKYIWLSNDGDTAEDNCVWVIDKALLLDENTTEIRLEKMFYPETRGATCYAEGGYLYVGEYYDGGRYSTKESHRFDTADGERNALICVYEIDETNELGIASLTPVKAYSVRDKLQGVAIGGDGEIILSRSGAIMNSKLEAYKPGDTADSTLTVDGAEVPVYYLDSNDLVHEVTMPPMSEGIVYKEGRVLVLYESASTKYVFGILTRGKDVYSYQLDK